MNLAQTLRGALDPEAVAAEGVERWRVGGRSPEAVVSPGDDEGVAAALRLAAEAGAAVLPAGRGSGPAPAPPSGPFVILSTRRLAGLEVYEPADLTLTVGAGTTLGDLDRRLASHGQWLPLDPPGGGDRTVGSAVATGAAGPLWAMYGAPRDNVLGLTVVTGDGRVLKLGGRVMKNVAGFDLVRLIVGSRGSLGVVTSASLRVFPLPDADRALILEAESLGELVEAARAVATAPVLPASASLVSEPARLVVRLHGAPESVDADLRTLEAHAGVSFQVLDGEEAEPVLARVRDGGAGGPVVLRLAGLPAALGRLVEALEAELPGAEVTADALSGRIRAGVEEVSRERLAALRKRVEGAGRVRVESGPPELAGEGPLDTTGPTSRLAAELKAAFDPDGTLPAIPEAR